MKTIFWCHKGKKTDQNVCGSTARFLSLRIVTIIQKVYHLEMINSNRHLLSLRLTLCWCHSVKEDWKWPKAKQVELFWENTAQVLSLMSQEKTRAQKCELSTRIKFSMMVPYKKFSYNFGLLWQVFLDGILLKSLKSETLGWQKF